MLKSAPARRSAAMASGRAGHGAPRRARVRSQPVVHLGVAVDGDAHEESALGEKAAQVSSMTYPLVWMARCTCLLRAMRVHVGAERAEEVETRAWGSPPWKAEGHLGIWTQGEGAVDHRLDRRGVHDAMVGGLAVLRDVGVKSSSGSACYMWS